MASIKKYLWIAHLFAIAVCAYFLAQTVTTYISLLLEEGGSAQLANQSPLKKGGATLLGSASEYDIVIKRNIFNSQDVAEEPKLPTEEARQAVDLSAEAVKTSLNIKVLGTLVVNGGRDRRSSATVVGGKSRKPEVFYVGDEDGFEDRTQLVRVKKHRIEFTNKGRLEYAMLEGVDENLSIFASAAEVHHKGEKTKKVSKSKSKASAEGVKVAEEKSFVIDQGELDEALGNLDRLYTEIRIVPNFKGGRPAGMKVLAVKPGSLFSKLGLKRGDVLERINGLELDIRKGMELFAQLREQKSLQLDIVRRGKNETLEYEIK